MLLNMDIKNLITLSMIKGIGPSFIKRNLRRIQSDKDCTSLVKEHKPDQLDYIPVFTKDAEKIIEDCKAENIEIISILSSDYPHKLLEINDPPSVLYIKGNKKLLNHCIAIIGTRKSSVLGNRIAEKLGCFFSQDFSICNGLVEGIDEHSIHTGDSVLPNVVGIISGGLLYKETCTKGHVKIINEVLSSGGLIISEYAPHVKEDKFSGSKASRIQAGLSEGLILVQSTIDGGSKYTIATFAKLGRNLGIIHFPSSTEYNTDAFSANRLIAEKKINGIAEMIGAKNISKLKVNSITVIESKEDYEIFSKRISQPTPTLGF